MTNLSLTQTGNFVALIMVVSQLFDLDLDEGQVTEAAVGVIALLAIVTSFYGRWRKGDLTLFGTRK